jgi:hypothetical protein
VEKNKGLQETKSLPEASKSQTKVRARVLHIHAVLLAVPVEERGHDG